MNGSSRTLPLSRGLEAFVDAEDYEWASQYKWSAGSGSHPYPFRNDRTSGRGTAVRLHREIMRPPSGSVVDHIDGNPLNNCRSNLRVVSRQENHRNRAGPQRNNSTGLLGVSRRRGGWRAYIAVNNRQKHLGQFNTKEDAMEARKAAEIKYYGENSAAYRRD